MEHRSSFCRWEIAAVAALLLVSIGVQWWVVSTSRIPKSSDQAISALMAKHILEGRGHPVFYYGSAYGGSVEPHYLAVVFAVLGSTFTAYRIGMGTLVLLTIAGVYAITRREFGRNAAIFAAGYLAIPPFFFLYKGLTSDGHYNAFNLFVVLTVLISLAIDRAFREGSDPKRLFAPLGAALGLGWWINPITPPVAAAALAWLFFKRRPRPSVRHAALLGAGFAVGSAPWTIWNVRHGWRSLAATPELSAVEPERAVHNLSEVALFSLPTLAGGGRFRVLDSWDTFPFSRPAVIAVIAILVGPTLWRAARGNRVFRLFWLAFAMLVFTVIWSSRYVPNEPRVLFPYYVLIPPLIGAGFASMLRRPAGRIFAAVLAAALVAAHVRSLTVEHRHLRNAPAEATASLAGLQQTLEREGLKRVYTDYWTAYRLSFESGERIVAAPLRGEEAVRYPPYQLEVARDPKAGVVIRPPRDRCFEAYLRQEALPYRRVRVEPFTVFARLPSSVLKFVEVSGALPLPHAAYRAAWTLGPHPAEIPRSATGLGTVSVSNVGTCAWPHVVHLGYHWRPLDPRLPYVHDGGRHAPNRRIEPGETVSLAVELKPPAEAGRYLLEYDLVLEQVAWFASEGSATATVPIRIR